MDVFDIIWCSLVSLSTPLTSEPSVEDELHQLRENYETIRKLVEQQGNVIQTLREKQSLSESVKEVSVAGKSRSRDSKNAIQRTCRETRAADPSLPSGMYWIDPDGQGVGDDPIYVHCNMATGSTSVLHDTETSVEVDHCTDPGCYSKAISYSATSRQIAALISLSNECHQSIMYNCTSAPFEVNGVTYSWWNDKNANPQYFWAGSNSSVHTCQCGIDHDCVESFQTCNCDSLLQIPQSDYGIITSKNLLPVTRLNFGRTILETSSGIYTLGRLECSGQIAIAGMPTSCADLWQIGHTHSGFYSVKGANLLETVYCDFSKIPGDTGFQNWIGFNTDIKTSEVYFYVLKTSSFSTLNAPVPFEVEELNIGGAMNKGSGKFTAPKNGIYFFSLSGLAYFSASGSFHLALYLNNNVVGRAFSDHTNGGYGTFALQSTLSLKAGDQVWLASTAQSNAIWNGNGYTHFTGWLVQEDRF